jgi:DNA repair exonuclease SbcCD ATPase subunit
MIKKIDIGQEAKVVVKWNVHHSNYTKELEKSIISLMAQKYNIPEKNIRVEVNYINLGNNGIISNTDTQNIHDPKFQLDLMKQFITINQIEDVDFNEIVKIDSQINSLIDYDSYGKSKRYTIKWVRWDNFLSYGSDNFFDFTKLDGLVLLNGEPANKSGKSTFAYDLLHFILFGKTNTNKAKTLGELFNNYLPEERTVDVEGCINIDGEDYIIRRTLTRPAKGKKSKTITNKVEYYKIAEDGSKMILPENNEGGASTTQTSAIIKEALGNENDFDLIISANAKDLDSLITLSETERGRLLSKWIGLSILEDKDVKAREKWNKEISVGRYSDMYNSTILEQEITRITLENEELEKIISSNDEKIKASADRIIEYNKTRDSLLLAKPNIDENLLKIDSTTLQEKINRLIDEGKRRKLEAEAIQKDIDEIGIINFSEDEYIALKKENNSIINAMAELRVSIQNLKDTNTTLAKSEYCPTCHRKLDGVDHSAQIAVNNTKIEEFTKQSIGYKNRSDEINTLMSDIENKRILTNKKNQLELKLAAINTDISSKRLEYVEKKRLLDDINKNLEAITINSKLDADINVVNTSISTEEKVKSTLELDNKNKINEINSNKQTIALRKQYLLKIEEERKIEKNWKVYLQMIGKDGISKMVLRNTLPIINNELNKLLSDSCDFKIEIVMSEKNDIDFLLVRDDIVTKLSAASGLEKTQASLALRVILGSLSKLSKPPFILLDEVLGTVAKENYDDMKKIYDKIADYYDFILHITHISDIVDWHKSIITVKKDNNISSIK